MSTSPTRASGGLPASRAPAEPHRGAAITPASSATGRLHAAAVAAVGLPFVLFGLYLTVGRFVVRAVVSRRTRYVVTDRRLLLLGGGFSGDRTVAQYLSALPPPVIKEAPDGSGSLAFGAFPSLADVFTGNRQRRPALWSGEFSVMPVLRHISDVRRVRDLIAEAQHTGAR
jgi:hypothetical protein